MAVSGVVTERDGCYRRFKHRTGGELHVLGGHSCLASGLGFCLHHFNGYVVPLEVIRKENELCTNVFALVQSYNPINSDSKATIWGCAFVLAQLWERWIPARVSSTQ